MVRLRNTAGVIVRVADADATKLGNGWSPVEDPPQPSAGGPRPSKRTTRRKTDDDDKE